MTSILFGERRVRPHKVICVGKNYAAHIEEMNSVPSENMTVFMKPATSISDQLLAVREEPIHFEGELCLLIENQRVAGVGFGLDLTKRQLQGKLKSAGLPWERAKAFDGAALFSKFVPAPKHLNELSLELFIDNELRQRGSPSQMLYPPEVIVEEISRFLTLEDGDVVMTGTPSGVGPVPLGGQFYGRILLNEIEITSASWKAE